MKNQKIKKLGSSILLGFFMIILIQSGVAQEIINGGIVGKVIDAKTGKPLFGVNIIVKKTLFGTSSDIKGNFSITNLPIGIYDIEASMIGYKKQIKRQIQIFPAEKHKIIFKLTPTVIEQPALVVTASKRKQHIEDAPTSVDVVTMKEIQERGATTLDEILQNTAGFGIIDGQIDLRGSTGFNWSAGSRVLLMVDGHPLINGDTGGINWDAIPIEEVKRVEIVGSVRRMKETNGDIDILTIARYPRLVMDRFVKAPWVAEVEVKGPAKTTVFLDEGIECDLRVFKEEEFGAALGTAQATFLRHPF